jgi:hypothetical protein
MNLIKPYIIRDTREKTGKGWDFTSSQYFSGTKNKKLETGDYSIEGFEGLLTIERKGSLVEFANNLLQDRFEKELERMVSIPYRYIILEFDLDEVMGYPFNQKLPKRVKMGIKIRGPYILRKIIEYQQQYGVYIIMSGSHGKETAMAILKNVLRTKN